MSRFKRVFARAGAILAVVGAIATFLPAAPASAGPQPAGLATINGAGSTWVYIAINQWQADVRRQGVPVNFTANGSTAGRVFYYQNQADFAASEIPFQAAYRDSTGTVTTNEVAFAAHRPYAYLPDVAGGTSFMYHLDVNGQRLTNLRLSPTTLAKIFTGVIDNWNDPAIAADNGGRQLPSLLIKPVIRSDGSGTTAQFTAYMANQTASIWQAFCDKVGIHLNPCPATSLYPPFDGSIAQQLSDGVATFVANPANNGAITYVEYGYAKAKGFPVASVLNKAGYYSQPTPSNVAIALTKATINADRTQNLVGVYNNPDPRSYPVSSYSYLIVPTTTASPFSTAKGETLGRFILYAVCVGQTKAGELGYSPLPPNLVQYAFAAEKLIPGAPAPPPLDAAHCANPWLTGDSPLAHAPPPPAGSKASDPPVGAPPPQPGSGPSGSGGSGGGSGGNGLNGATNTTAPARSSGGGNGLTGGTTPAQQIGVTRDVASGPIDLPGKHDPLPLALYVLAGAIVLLIVFAPPGVALAMRSRERRRGAG
ncbi:MAG TPA: phosphate ABC transporter substrate-binding protein PstS [Acidimicrobiia bacterium]|nr:phosphate ABC transporter substrate-binding protein PstS [Acidimicrobiia bacterium]